MEAADNRHLYATKPSDIDKTKGLNRILCKGTKIQSKGGIPK